MTINSTKLYPLDSHNGRPTHYQVKGSKSDYHVYIPEKPIKCRHWTSDSPRVLAFLEYRPTCHSKADPNKFPVCKGNSNGTVCKHCLAAINDRIRRAGKQVSWPEDGEFSSAVKLLNSGGQLVKVRNQNGVARWGIVR